MLADILDTELVTVNSEEGAAYGAALLAASGSGAFPDVPSACRQVIEITERTVPGKSVDTYQELYPVYRRVYPALQPVFHAGTETIQLSSSPLEEG